jgi:hypothetical protein
MADIWDYVYHYTILHGQSMAKKYQKNESNSRNLCPSMCMFNAMVDLHSFCFLLRCHLPYWTIQWMANKRSDLSHVICSFSHAYVMSGVTHLSFSLDHPGLYFMWSSTYYHYSSSSLLNWWWVLSISSWYQRQVPI